MSALFFIFVGDFAPRVPAEHCSLVASSLSKKRFPKSRILKHTPILLLNDALWRYVLRHDNYSPLDLIIITVKFKELML